MFMYAATPDFRLDLISRYTALDARIGGTAFSAGSPMVPFIDLDPLMGDALTVGIAQRLREVFSRACDKDWDESVQQHNLELLMNAEKEVDFTTVVSPRRFVYHYCLMLEDQRRDESRITESGARRLAENQPPEFGE